MNKIVTLLGVVALVTISQSASAQCINKFPYNYGFETFDSLQTDASCDVSIVGDSAGGWYQDRSDGGDWRADTAGTASLYTGPGSTDSTSGDSTGTDYSEKTTSGVYLYTEATQTNNGCSGYTVNLLSPCFDLSGTKYYEFEFAYHMHGPGMGSLSVDVNDGSGWDNDLWTISGDQGENWNVAKVGLAKFYNKSSVQIRIRAVIGTTYTSDCAIDAVAVKEYTPLDYDAEMVSGRIYSNNSYFFMPGRHADSIHVDATVRNLGIKDLTYVQVIASLPSRSDTTTIGTMKAYDRQSLTKFASFIPQVGDEVLTLSVTQRETDGNTANNTLRFNTGVTDSIYSRDDGNALGGVGANGSTGQLEIGNMYSLKADDTLTTVSFYISPNGSIGDSVRVNLYEYSGAPSTLIARTKNIILNRVGAWYTVAFDCDQHLKKGDYFVAVQQMSANNMSLGYNTDFYTAGETVYRFNNTGGWTNLVLNGIGSAVSVRMNLGEILFPRISTDLPDTICESTQYIVTASGAETYVWSPRGPLKTTTGEVVRVLSDTSFTLKVVGTDGCGKTGELVQRITVQPNPSLVASNDTTVCTGETVQLFARTGGTYRWVNGPSDSSYTVSPKATTSYEVIADSAGCLRSKNIRVTISIPEPVVSNDTTVCEGQPVELMASGGANYKWTNGPNKADYTVRPRSTTSYEVEVIDQYSCSAFDTVKVTTIDGPNLTTSNDTAVCFGSRVLLQAYGANNYEWDRGPSTATYNALPISTKTYYVKGYATNGCFLEDSVQVEVVNIPLLSLRNDTLVCEGTTLDIEAETPDQVQFAWNTGETTSSISVSPTEQTTYKVVVSNTTGCSAEDSVTISVDPLPVIDFNFSQSHKNITIINNSLHGDSYEWIFGDGDTSREKSVTHRYRVHGDYDLTYTITNKCGSKDTTFTVVVENLSVDDVARIGVKAFPNPIKDVLNLKVQNPDLTSANVVVRDMTGRVVFDAPLSQLQNGGVYTLELDYLSAGQYLLELHSTIGNHALRFTKE